MALTPYFLNTTDPIYIQLSYSNATPRVLSSSTSSCSSTTSHTSNLLSSSAPAPATAQQPATLTRDRRQGVWQPHPFRLSTGTPLQTSYHRSGGRVHWHGHHPSIPLAKLSPPKIPPLPHPTTPSQVNRPPLIRPRARPLSHLPLSRRRRRRRRHHGRRRHRRRRHEVAQTSSISMALATHTPIQPHTAIHPHRTPILLPPAAALSLSLSLSLFSLSTELTDRDHDTAAATAYPTFTTSITLPSPHLPPKPTNAFHINLPVPPTPHQKLPHCRRPHWPGRQHHQHPSTRPFPP